MRAALLAFAAIACGGGGGREAANIDDVIRRSVPGLGATAFVLPAALRHWRDAAVGTPIDEPWRGLVETLERWAEHPEEVARADALEHAVRACNDVLAERALPYQIVMLHAYDEYPFRLMGFAVDRTVTVRVQGRPYETRDVHQIDIGVPLEPTYGMVVDGYIARPLAIVFRDAIDEAAASLAGTLDGADARVTATAWPDDDGRAYREATTAAIRRELAGCARAARRQDCVAELVANSARRHELQHVLDFERIERLPPSADLLGTVPPEVNEVIATATRELSGWLSGIANDDIPQHALWTLASHCMKRPDARHHPQLYTAIVAIAAIARQLGLSPPLSLLRDGQVDRYAIAKLAIEIAKRDGRELRAAAAAAYRDQFGEPVAEITLSAAESGAGTRP